MPCSKTSFLKLLSIHRFRCLMLSKIFKHLFMTKNLQSQWRAKFMNFWLTYFRSRFALCSLWSVIFLCLLCLYYTLLAPPPTSTNFAWTIVFKSSPWEDCIFPKEYENNTLWKTWEANKVHYGGFENSQWEGGECTPVTPLPHYSPLRSQGIFLAAHRREYWSQKYPLRTCLHQKNRTLIERVHLLRVLFILFFCKICFLYLTVKPSASRSSFKM